MRVVEIFKSIEGEGKRAGLPCTFIRLFGCNLRCKYCDTVYGWDTEKDASWVDMPIGDIVQKVKDFKIPHVTVTGGEPLIQSGIEELLESLADAGFEINVETNGSMMPKVRRPEIFYTIDYKTDASGMSKYMNLDAISSASADDVIKFVVGSIEDCEQSKQIIETLDPIASIYFSPVFGQINPEEIVKFILSEQLYHCKVQLQLHKIIWDPEKRGV